MTKKIFAGLAIVIVLGIGYYLLSPLWRKRVVNEASPVTKDQIQGQTNTSLKTSTSTEHLSPEQQVMLEKEMAKMKDVVTKADQSMPATPRVLSQAPFIASAHDVQGKALLIDTGKEKIIRFENFKTINGPALRIYLATDLSAKDFVDLGEIKATEGNVNYQLPAGTDTSKYKNVLVWCKAFSILFSYAQLQ